LRIVLDLASRREVLLEFLLGDQRNGCVRAEENSPRRGCALVDGEDVGGQMAVRLARSARPREGGDRVPANNNTVLLLRSPAFAGMNGVSRLPPATRGVACRPGSRGAAASARRM